MKHNFFYIFLLFLFIAPHECGPYSFTVSIHDLTVAINEVEQFKLLLKGQLNEDVILTFIRTVNFIDINPNEINIKPNESSLSNTVNIKGLHAGRSIVTAQTIPNDTWIAKDVFVRVTVCKSPAIYYLSLIVGWIYFIAWSISFYPQIISNYRRKSVIGLNFDFVALNLVGFVVYSIFNVGLYWIPEIQEEYFNRNPRGLNPVYANDIFFSLHAVVATCTIIIQCFLYERADQKLSHTLSVILSVFLIIITITSSMAIDEELHWLDFLYSLSYLKLAITLIKYIPQAVMNFRRKSTVGWSIGNILLDFVGGSLSMLQMILNSYNYDDWASIFGDPTKFGLGLFSVCFDIFFMLQHYVFYRNSQPYEEIQGDDSENESTVNLVNDDPTV